jgi:hypothetical protein
MSEMHWTCLVDVTCTHGNTQNVEILRSVNRKRSALPRFRAQVPGQDLNLTGQPHP